MARTRRSEAGASAEYDLKYWGLHIGAQYAADGYPSECPLLMLLSGHSDLNPLSPKFGINTKDIPADAWRINAMVMQIPGYIRATLIGRYCLPVDYETGQPIDPRLIADVIGMSLRSYYRLLDEARRRFVLLRTAGPNVVAFVALRPCVQSTT